MTISKSTLRCAAAVLLLSLAACSSDDKDSAAMAEHGDADMASMPDVMKSRLEDIPKAEEATLRNIGAKFDIPATAALYTPFFPDGYLDVVQVTRNQHYGPAERNVLDVMTLPNLMPKRPVVVFVHGGGFGAGNKNSDKSPFYDNIPYWVAMQGMVGVNINYRYAPDSKWPSGIEDLTNVVRWIKDNIDQYGGDANKIFLWGKSTGGSHVSDYIASRVKNRQPEDIMGAIFTSGSFALGDEPLWTNYYGDDVSKYPEMNALPNLVKSKVPMFASYAEFDPQQYHDQFDMLMKAAQKAGKHIEGMYLQGHSHMSETYAVGTDDDTLTGPVLDFIYSTVTNGISHGSPDEK